MYLLLNNSGLYFEQKYVNIIVDLSFLLSQFLWFEKKNDENAIFIQKLLKKIIEENILISEQKVMSTAWVAEAHYEHNKYYWGFLGSANVCQLL